MCDLIGDIINFVAELGMTKGASGLMGKQRALVALMIFVIVGALSAGAVLLVEQQNGLGLSLMIAGFLMIAALIFALYHWAKPKN